jgi:hypothetical protein
MAHFIPDTPSKFWHRLDLNEILRKAPCSSAEAPSMGEKILGSRSTAAGCDCHIGSMLRQRDGNRPANPASAAGHQCGLTGEIKAIQIRW